MSVFPLPPADYGDDYVGLQRKELDELTAKVEQLTADRDRFDWYFGCNNKPMDFLLNHLKGMQEKWSVDQWRAAIDKARPVSNPGIPPGEIWCPHYSMPLIDVEGGCLKCRAARKPPAASPEKPEDTYYIQDSRDYVGNSMLWWGFDGRGYVCDITKAGVYSKEAAFRQTQSTSDRYTVA
jgi:hypothetical protein